MTTSMRVALGALAVLLAAGCAKEAAPTKAAGHDALLGAWVMDTAALGDLTEGLEAEQKDTLQGHLAGVQMTVTFTKDTMSLGHTAKDAEARVQQMRYTAGPVDGGGWKVVAAPEGGKAQTFTVRVDGDTLTMERGPGDSRTFKRR